MMLLNWRKSKLNKKNPALKNKAQVAEQVGVGAVIFHDLKNERLNNFDFDLAEVVRFEGETGPYVQYSHARAQSILRKAKNLGVEPAIGEDISIAPDEDTWNVLKQLNDFPVAINRAVQEYEPSVIAKYALHLAKSF
jgi:arginyl-tRNA synthetase